MNKVEKFSCLGPNMNFKCTKYVHTKKNLYVGKNGMEDQKENVNVIKYAEVQQMLWKKGFDWNNGFEMIPF